MKKIIFALLLTSIYADAQAQDPNDKIKVGQMAPDLAFPTPKGDTIRLSEINKGRIVLLDFWASWCGPCRRANPRLVALYKEYQDKKFIDAKKGFTIVSVSMDQKKDAWVAAIAKDSLIWEHHMSDLNSWNAVPAAEYGVRYIPQAFLLGPDGKVIGKYNFAEEAAVEIEKHVKQKKKKG